MHGLASQAFGLLLSINAILVVLLQFWVTRRIKHGPPMLMMAAGTTLYVLGFSMFGVISGYSLFVVAVVIITVGEMITAPVGQALVAQLAPEDMRGRHMAVWGFGWLLPSVVGPLGAGLIMDNLDPRLVWYLAGVFCALSTAGYLLLHRGAGARLAQAAGE